MVGQGVLRCRQHNGGPRSWHMAASYGQTNTLRSLVGFRQTKRRRLDFTPYGAGFRKSHRERRCPIPTDARQWEAERLLLSDASRELIPRARIADNRRCSVSRPVTPRVQQRDCSRPGSRLVSRARVPPSNNNDR